MWVGVKGQSNSVIAGSPRNIFRYSLARFVAGVEHCLGAGPHKVTNLRQTPKTVDVRALESGSGG